MKLCGIWAFAALALSACLGALDAAPLPRSVSTSRQFIVYGPDRHVRAAMCDLAERTKRTALALLNERDAWKTPIVIEARSPATDRPELPPAQLSVGQTGFGLKLQLEFRIDRQLDASAIEREVLRAVFLEMMYRGHSDVPAGAEVVEPPDWLLDGTLALAEARGSAAVAETLATALATNNVITVQDFVRQRPALLDSPSRALYRAYAAAFVNLLTAPPDGAARLARFISHLPQSGRDLLVELEKLFPELAGSAEIRQANWTAAITRFAARERFRLLSCEETERQLAQLLRVELRDARQQVRAFALEEFPQFVRDPGAPAALKHLTQSLLLLGARAHPLYRPVLTEYQEVLALLGRKKTSRMVERLAQLRATREHINRRMSAVADYLNWFEATQSRTTSGTFGAYMRAVELAAEREYRRRDPISVYLDALETQLE
ncbi:MAG TPA: hypothetical protein VG095_01390 [Chthoniobacterales bacterium]|nr:hypothetical protein [Chthoniobacterales bacterium]